MRGYEVIDEMQKELVRIKAINTELAAACDHVLNDAADDTDGEIVRFSTRDKIRAALKKHREGA